jgi:hypothetical protein
MNYLAHGWRYSHEPYVLAGTAAPDWLSVIDRKTRLRSRTAAEFVHDTDPIVAAIARGIVQHHIDDGWFHATPAFNELSLQFSVEIREMLPGDEGFRPSFLGHIIIDCSSTALSRKTIPNASTIITQPSPNSITPSPKVPSVASPLAPSTASPP